MKINKKYTDLNENEKENINNLVENNYYGNERFKYIPKITEMGLCSTCKHYLYAKSEFKIRYSKCSELNIFLYSSDPIIECCNYRKKGQLSLFEMKELAYLIDDQDKPIGF